jgi:aromatic ring-opening dioxygenase LigB subunit
MLVRDGIMLKEEVEQIDEISKELATKAFSSEKQQVPLKWMTLNNLPGRQNQRAYCKETW